MFNNAQGRNTTRLCPVVNDGHFCLLFRSIPLRQTYLFSERICASMCNILMKFKTSEKKNAALEVYRELTKRGHFALSLSEERWRDRYYMLEKHGYRLRPRYHPEWVPSWTETDKLPIYCEDFYNQRVRRDCLVRSNTNVSDQYEEIMDAIRISDNSVVIIKEVKANSGEIRLGKYLSEPELREDEDNHCVPILDDFHDEGEPDMDFFVMPLLRPFDDPPFYSVKEVADFMEQTLRVRKTIFSLHFLGAG